MRFNRLFLFNILLAIGLLTGCAVGENLLEKVNGFLDKELNNEENDSVDTVNNAWIMDSADNVGNKNNTESTDNDDNTANTNDAYNSAGEVDPKHMKMVKEMKSK